MTNSQPLNQVIWYKGLKWLMQFIINYIMQNFCPNPDLPNQKAERYTDERIKADANENLRDKIKDRKYFVFD